MTTHRYRSISSGALALIVSALSGSPELANAQEPETFRNVYRARVVDMSTRQSSIAGHADFIVTRWSTAAERTMLMNTLENDGHDEFMKTLRMREETGYLSPQTTQTSGYGAARFHYAYQFDLEDGAKRIVIVTDRRIRAGASASEAREYDTTLITMDFPANSDKGTGEMYWAVRVRWNKDENKIKLESPGTEGLRLTEIKLVK